MNYGTKDMIEMMQRKASQPVVCVLMGMPCCTLQADAKHVVDFLTGWSNEPDCHSTLLAGLELLLPAQVSADPPAPPPKRTKPWGASSAAGVAAKHAPVGVEEAMWEILERLDSAHRAAKECSKLIKTALGADPDLQLPDRLCELLLKGETGSHMPPPPLALVVSAAADALEQLVVPACFACGQGCEWTCSSCFSGEGRHPMTNFRIRDVWRAAHAEDDQDDVEDELHGAKNYKRACVVTQVFAACEEAIPKAPERLAGAVSFAQLVRRLDNALSRFSQPQERPSSQAPCEARDLHGSIGQKLEQARDSARRLLVQQASLAGPCPRCSKARQTARRWSMPSGISLANGASSIAPSLSCERRLCLH
jgi:hypothetical protein